MPLRSHFSPTDEHLAITELAYEYRKLRFTDDGILETRNSGASACKAFLNLLAFVTDRLHCRPADRTYRLLFSPNYKKVFPDMTRRYSVDVLEACLSSLSTFLVNAQHYELSANVVDAGGKLRCAWRRLSTLLLSWDVHSSGMRGQPLIGAMLVTLTIVDSAWAAFEQAYIFELMRIEEDARGMVIDAIRFENHLRRLEDDQAQGSPVQARHQLVQSIARLNAVANFKRTGRDDLTSLILESAFEVVRQPERHVTQDAAFVLATDVVATLNALRKYFRHAGVYPERLDPHLRNNRRLVEKLVAWEEAWEVGMVYLPHRALRQSLCSTVACLRSIHSSDAFFRNLATDCDVELFVVLPRLLWLFYLDHPEQHMALLASVLPSVFEEDVSDECKSVTLPGKDLQEFIGCYATVRHHLHNGSLRALAGANTKGAAIAVSALSSRAIRGPGWQVAQQLDDAVFQAIEAFMLRLEHWSMQLQRHCPNDWNKLSAVLMRCLNVDA